MKSAKMKNLLDDYTISELKWIGMQIANTENARVYIESISKETNGNIRITFMSNILCCKKD